MKKNMIAFVALLTMATFTRVVMAQTPAKPTAPAVTDKPSVSAAVGRMEDVLEISIFHQEFFNCSCGNERLTTGR